MSERSILQRLHHPFLVNLHYSFQSEDKVFFFWMTCGDLLFHSCTWFSISWTVASFSITYSKTSASLRTASGCTLLKFSLDSSTSIMQELFIGIWCWLFPYNCLCFVFQWLEAREFVVGSWWTFEDYWFWSEQGRTSWCHRFHKNILRNSWIYGYI